MKCGFNVASPSRQSIVIFSGSAVNVDHVRNMTLYVDADGNPRVSVRHTGEEFAHSVHTPMTKGFDYLLGEVDTANVSVVQEGK
jgi:hypothetical protein